MTGPAPSPDPGATGLFGKLPAHGDFVRRGLRGGFCEAWDAWLRAGILAARAALGEAGWQAAWQATPPWRFLLPAGTCGPDAVAGVMLPSRDAVGRAFPLTVATLGPGAAGCVAWPPSGAWFPLAEGAAQAGRDQWLDADALLALLPAPLAVAADDPPPEPGWWTAGTAATPGLVWPLAALPAPEAFAALLGEATPP